MSRSYEERIWEGVPEDAAPGGSKERAEFVLESLPRASQTRLLDIGCGDGRIGLELKRAGLSVLCADIAQEPLHRAQGRGLETRLLEPVGPWPFADASFDAVWAGEVIEHVLDTPAWLSELRRVLRSGGTLLMSTPDHGPLRRLALALVPGAFERHFDPRGDHLRFYTSRSIAELLAQFGFDEVRVRAAGGIPGARATLLVSATRRGYPRELLRSAAVLRSAST
jgi:2-polyprenyl-3-methyl-5-hydroxy-6-metoxy-1,4-benzoquinol methylase